MRSPRRSWNARPSIASSSSSRSRRSRWSSKEAVETLDQTAGAAVEEEAPAARRRPRFRLPLRRKASQA